MDILPIRRAILSVTDKSGLVEFATFLTSRGVELISTGGTLLELETLAAKRTGTVVGCCAALAEGDAAKRTDIFFLEPLPLFLH